MNEADLPASIDREVDFIIEAAPRLAKLAAMVTVSFGLGEGANRALWADKFTEPRREQSDDWNQAVLVYQDGAFMMAVIRVVLLLDDKPDSVSFQTVYHRLKRDEVQIALIKRVFGDNDSIEEIFGRAPVITLTEFLANYASIDWSIFSRLKHFRNLGIAHLSTSRLSKKVQLDELKLMANIVAKLGDQLVALCRTDFAHIEGMLEDWSNRGFSILKPQRAESGSPSE